jgi:hypothetical protein
VQVRAKVVGLGYPLLWLHLDGIPAMGIQGHDIVKRGKAREVNICRSTRQPKQRHNSQSISHRCPVRGSTVLEVVLGKANTPKL